MRRIEKRNLWSFLACLLLVMQLGSSGIVRGMEKFSDVKDNHWAREAIYILNSLEIATGYEDGSFRPDNPVTYGEFINMVTGALPYIEDVTPNAIVKGGITWETTGHWAGKDYDMGKAIKLFEATDIKASELDKPITRGDMCLVAARAVEDQVIEDYRGILNSLSDVDHNTRHDYEIVKACSLGLIAGYGDGTIRPQGHVTRAEACAVIHRLIRKECRLKAGEKNQKELEEQKKEVQAGAWNENRVLERLDAELGEYGIKGFLLTGDGYVAILCSRAYEDIRLVVEGLAGATFGNGDGTNYWLIDGYYTYFVDPVQQKLGDVRGKVPSVWLPDGRLITFTDAVIK